MSEAKEQNLPTILLAMGVSAAVVVGLVIWGRSRAASSGAAPDARPVVFEPAGFLPDLKVGDTVAVDPTEANMPAALRTLPLVLCTVDILMSDPTLVSVRANVVDFRGTIPRTAIKRVIPKPAPGVFA